MYQKGEYVMYASTGVCKVEDIAELDNIPGKEKGALYYKLTPVYGTGNIYIPIDTTVYMRPVLTKQQADALIDQLPYIEECTYAAKDQRDLAEHYRASIRAHEYKQLVGMLKAIYQKHKKLEESGRKLGKADVEYMKQAQALLHGELAVVLGIPFEQVPEYIAARIEQHK